MKKWIAIIFLLAMVSAQEALAYLYDPDRARSYFAGYSRYGDWAWAFGFVGSPPELRCKIRLSNNYPGFMFQAMMMGKMKVTGKNSREFIYQFLPLSGLSFEKADLLFMVRGPKKGSATATLLADGTEIFASELSRRRMEYRLDLLEIAPASLRDGQLVLKFLASEGAYFIPRITLTLKATEMGSVIIPIPTGLWLLGSGLGILGAIKLIKKKNLYYSDK